MVYIVVLNWNNAKDTISCLRSLSSLNRSENYKIIICDNLSTDGSYQEISSWLSNNADVHGSLIVELDNQSSQDYVISDSHNTIYLIQTGGNFGFAGGNNVGIRFAINQSDAEYVWLLNNDTEVEVDSLQYLVGKARSNKKIGICGSKLIYFHDRNRLQGLGGIYNKFLSTTKHYLAFSPSSENYDEFAVEGKIDYVIGASMLLSVSLIKSIGLLSEDYFLYFEELDYAERARRVGYLLGVSQKSIVYHKEGATTKATRGDLSDYLSVVNRLVFTNKHNKMFSPIVYFSLFLCVVNRVRRSEIKKAIRILKFMFGVKSYIIVGSKVYPC